MRFFSFCPLFDSECIGYCFLFKKVFPENWTKQAKVRNRKADGCMNI